jgi:hypothetical protein
LVHRVCKHGDGVLTKREVALARLEASCGLLAVIALGTYVRAVDPHESGSYPTCPWRALTGLACPGCGSLRALHDLLRGRFLEALDHNAMFVFVLPLSVVLAVGFLLSPRSPRALPRWVPLGALVALLMWAVARNLPFWPLSVLAP